MYQVYDTSCAYLWGGQVDTGWRLRQGLLSVWHHQRLQLKAGSPTLPDQQLHEKHRGQEASRKRALAP